MKLTAICGSAGAGGAIYFQCQYIGDACDAVLLEKVKFPHSQGSLNLSKIQFEGNSASGFGQNIATDPNQMFIINSNILYERSLVPGVDAISLNVAVIDGLGQTVTGTTYTCSLVFCAQSEKCGIDKALVSPIFYLFDPAQGACSVSDVELVCPVGSTETVAQVSLVSQNAAPAMISVKCRACQSGQARVLDKKGLTWWCTFCVAGKYVIDPNGPFGCQVLKFRCRPASFAGITRDLIF